VLVLVLVLVLVIVLVASTSTSTEVGPLGTHNIFLGKLGLSKLLCHDYPVGKHGGDNVFIPNKKSLLRAVSFRP
jgi:hypothetical protein